MTKQRFTLTGVFPKGRRVIDNQGKDGMTIPEMVDMMNELNNENTMLKEEIKDFQDLLASKEEVYLKPIITTIEEAYETERTHIGRNVLKQLLEQLE